jgi:hypothetical protein
LSAVSLGSGSVVASIFSLSQQISIRYFIAAPSRRRVQPYLTTSAPDRDRHIEPLGWAGQVSNLPANRHFRRVETGRGQDAAFTHVRERAKSSDQPPGSR